MTRLLPCSLEGVALDHERCLIRGKQDCFDGLIHLREQLLIDMAGAARVRAKGMGVRMNDEVFHQDKIGWLIVVMW